MKIEIRDFDPTKDKKGTVKGTLKMPDDGTVIEAMFQSADDIPKVQASIDAHWAESEAARAKQADEFQRRKDEMNAQISAKDAQIAAINREIEATRAKIRDHEALVNRLAHELIDTKDAAKRVLPGLNTDGMSAKQIRVALIKSQAGDSAIDGKSDDYIAARFDMIVDAAKPHNPDPFARVVRDGIRSASAAADEPARAYQEMVDSMQNAWQSADGDDSVH